MVASDLYSILGVKATATDVEIKKAYRKKALEFHPDKNSSSTAEETFKEINRAYATLSDVDKRRTYDLQQQKPFTTTTTTTTTSSSSSTAKSAPQSRKDDSKFKTSFHSPGQPHFTFSNSTNTEGNNSTRFRFHRMHQDPFTHFQQRQANFANAFFDPFRTNHRSNDFSFFDSSTTHLSSDDEDFPDDGIPTDRKSSTFGSDEFEFDSPTPPPRRSSQPRFTTTSRPKWNNNWPFDSEDDNKSSASSDRKYSSMFQQTDIDNPFMMFEMLTRAVFDKFFTDDAFWNSFDANSNGNNQRFHFPNVNPQQSSRSTSSRLRSSSQHRVPSTKNRTRIDVNEMPTRKNSNEMHFEWLGHNSKQKRTSSSSRFDQRDSDEENLQENFPHRPGKATNLQGQRLRRRPMNSNRGEKGETCQHCFLPFVSAETRLQHEASCRHRTTKSTNIRTKSRPAPSSTTSANEKLFTSKCSYCHQEVRLSDRLDHEALCKQFGTKRQTSSTTNNLGKRFSNPNSDNQFHRKPSSGNNTKPPSENSTAQ